MKVQKSDGNGNAAELRSIKWLLQTENNSNCLIQGLIVLLEGYIGINSQQVQGTITG